MTRSSTRRFWIRTTLGLSIIQLAPNYLLMHPRRDCPKCKTKRRAAKHLSLARLPPILVIHLKRFEIHGRFSDKIDTFVDYPLKSLDLTNIMPPPLPPGADKSQLNGGVPMSPDDPRAQMPPYKYNLYGVTNHSGNLTSGHCMLHLLQAVRLADEIFRHRVCR